MLENFQHLTQELCTLIKLNDSMRVFAGEPFFVNEVMFSLIYDPAVDGERFFLFAQFGDLPSSNAAEVLAALLRNNHLGYAGDGPGFSISPTTGKLNYCRHLILVKTDVNALANLMIYIANKAIEWRSTYFIDDNKLKCPQIQLTLMDKMIRS